MNTITPTVSPIAPTPAESRAAFIQFCATACALVQSAARDSAPINFLADTMESVSAALLEQTNEIEFPTGDVEDETAKSAISAWALHMEIWYFCLRFSSLLPEEQRVLTVLPRPDVVQIVAEDIYVVPEKQDLEDAQTIGDSIKKLYSKLPTWLQKIVDVILEALKITSGRMD